MNLLSNPLDFDSTPLKEVGLTLTPAEGKTRAASWEEPAPLMTSRVELSGQQLPWGRETNFHLVNIIIITIIIITIGCGMCCVHVCVWGHVHFYKWQMLMTSSVSIITLCLLQMFN